jgi:membrane protein YdbS with pleckstrin-like domain
MDLEPGEQIIFEGHPSWRSILGFYIKGILLVAVVVVVVVLAADTAPAAGAGIAALALVLVIGWVKRLFTTYTITSHRLHIRRGIISRKEQQTQISRVQNVNTNQGPLERILQFGTVDFDTAAGGDYDFKFVGVSDPHEVVEAVHRAQRESDTVAGGPTG